MLSVLASIFLFKVSLFKQNIQIKTKQVENKRENKLLPQQQQQKRGKK